jgi:hypothetical protein
VVAVRQQSSVFLPAIALRWWQPGKRTRWFELSSAGLDGGTSMRRMPNKGLSPYLRLFG